jgi:hypothetical protein
MRTTAISGLLGLALFALSYSVINLGWPPVGSESSGLVWGLSIIAGSICLFVSVASFGLFLTRRNPRVHAVIKLIVHVIGLLAGSVVASVLLTGGTCTVFPEGFLCGHNAGILLFLYFGVGFIGITAIYVWTTPPPHHNSHAKCSRCRQDVTFDAAVCPNCGFQFGKDSV